MSGSVPTTSRSSSSGLLSVPHRLAVARAAGPLVAVHAGLLAVFDLGRRPGWTLALLALAFAALVWGARRIEAAASPAAVLLVAALLRVLLLPLPPTLSDDVLRYVWDGRVLGAGFDPYRLAPEANELEALRDDLWRRMPHRDVPTVYPPLAQGLFVLAAWLPRPLVSLKILLTLADLGGCALLVRLARRLDRPPGRALWYAWNPLVVLEVAGMGHVDALGVAACVAAVLWLASRRPAASAAAAAAGVLAKLVPVVALPLWAILSGRPRRFLAVAGVLLLVVSLPILVVLGGPPLGLVRYGVAWEFDGPLFEPLWRGFRELGLADMVKAGIGAAVEPGLAARLYPFVYPQLLAKLVLALGLAGLVAASAARAGRRRGENDRAIAAADVVGATGRLLGGALLCSATLYPWYLLWVLPWAALARQRAWLTLAALMPLVYLPQLLGWPLYPWLFLVVWTPFFLLLVRSSWSIA